MTQLRLVVGVLTSLTACTVSPDPGLWRSRDTLPPTDKGAPGDGHPDTAGDAPIPADQTPGPPGPFGQGQWLFDTPRSLEIGGSGGNLHFTPDGQTVYFDAIRPGGAGGSDIYEASWSPGSLGPPTNLSSLNTADDEDSFSVSADGLAAVLVSNRAGGPGLSDVWLGNRTSASAPWTPAMFTVDAALSSTESDWDAILTADGLRVYLASYGWPPYPTAQQILFAQRATPATSFGPPTPVSGINDPGEAADPALTVDERVIVFASGRSGGAGGIDLWYAVRTDATSFSAPQPLPGPINTAANETEPEISPDGTTLIFIRQNAGVLQARILSGP